MYSLKSFRAPDPVFGFRNGRSAEDGVSKVIKYACNGLNEGFNGGARIVFDFSKTNGLMHLLKRKGTIVIQNVVLTYRLINIQAFIYACVGLLSVHRQLKTTGKAPNSSHPYKWCLANIRPWKNFSVAITWSMLSGCIKMAPTFYLAAPLTAFCRRNKLSRWVYAYDSVVCSHGTESGSS
uniref:Uncharacterized protein n=1 Tax=Glossina pallidipes TaxID=7398 RepID=A0A1A9ZBF3_GLOPL